MKSQLLFPPEQLPRSPRIVRMRVIEETMGCGMPEPGEQYVRFQCHKCEAVTDWEYVPSITAARRGIPCHNCNPATDEKNYAGTR